MSRAATGPKDMHCDTCGFRPATINHSLSPVLSHARLTGHVTFRGSSGVLNVTPFLHHEETADLCPSSSAA